jgi:arylsulfatase A
VKLAGGTVPADRKIDGADIAPLLFGRTKDARRESHYFFSGNRLEAVRSGPWKLAIALQSENIGKSKEAAKEPFMPVLYNLDEVIGETTDLAVKHPDVVKRLQELVAKMDADLGVAKPGPGVRPPGRVEKPRPLLLK